MVSMNINLSPEQANFFGFMADHAGFLLPLWDAEKREIKLSDFETFLTVASHGEAIMARFFAMIWLHSNKYEFDLFEASQVLSDHDIATITAWLNTPIYP